MMNFIVIEFLRWELLNPDAEMVYLPHPTPIDRVDMTFKKL